VSCTGACCVAFPVGASMDWIRGGDVTDGDLIGFMLRELTTEEAIDRRAEFGVTLPINPEHTYYRCIYWDESTRLCTAYEDRPMMCTDYPYPWTPTNGRGFDGNGVCEHDCGCLGSPLLWEGD
jgi:Fe-S-cluster containining protein